MNIQPTQLSLLQLGHVINTMALFSGKPHEALCYRGKKLCTVDVWQPDQRLHLHRRKTILPEDLPLLVEECESEEPIFSEEAFDSLQEPPGTVLKPL